MTPSVRSALLAASAVLIVFFPSAQSAKAQGSGNPPGLTCVANAAVSPTLRTEGITELVGDILLQCTGGIPTPAGQAIPQANITLFLNAAVTSKILNPLTGASEALLMIDDPGGPSNSGTPQLLCNSLDGCPVIGNGTGTGGFNGATGRPNLFQGIVSANQVTFNGVPILAPDPNGKRVFRITNVRANAAKLAGGLAVGKAQVAILGTVGLLPVTPGFTAPQITNPDGVILGFVQQSISTSVLNPQTQPNCLPLHLGLAATPPFSGDPPPPILRFSENFATAFKTRVATNVPQDVPGQAYNAESSFFLPPPATPQNFTGGGLADYGTRLKAVFNNIPQGVSIFVSTTNVSSTGAPMPPSSGTFAQLVTSETVADANGNIPAVPQFGTTGLAQVPVFNGSATAVWEVVNTNPSAMENFDFPVFMLSVPNPINNNANVPGNTITANLSFAPFPDPASSSLGLSNGTLAIPQFSNPLPSSGLFAIMTLAQCSGLAQNLTIGSIPANGLVFNSFGGNLIPAAPNVFYVTNNSVQTLTGISNGGGNGSYPIAPGGFGNDVFREKDFSYQVTPTATANSDRNWLKITSSGTASPETFTATVDPTGLAAGSFSGSISISALGQNSLTSTLTATVPVTLNVAAPGPVAPTAGFVSATTYQGNFAVPGLPLVVFGSAFGASSLTGLSLTPDNTTITTSVAGTRVLFDGTPAPMIYSANGQISTIVPFELAGKTSTQVIVEQNGAQAPAVTLPVLATAPGLFTANASGTGPGAILNANNDGTTSFNSPSNPAPVGSTIVLYAAGAGQTNPPGKTGHLAAAPFPAPVLPVLVFIDGVQAQVQYAGDAPGLFEGVLQVNAVIPAEVKPGNRVVIVKVGSTQTPPWATVAVSGAQ